MLHNVSLLYNTYKLICKDVTSLFKSTELTGLSQIPFERSNTLLLLYFCHVEFNNIAQRPIHKYLDRCPGLNSIIQNSVQYINRHRYSGICSFFCFCFTLSKINLDSLPHFQQKSDICAKDALQTLSHVQQKQRQKNFLIPKKERFLFFLPEKIKKKHKYKKCGQVCYMFYTGITIIPKL